MDVGVITSNLLFFSFVLFQVNNKFISTKDLITLIDPLYSNSEFKITEISKLGITEKLRYGVPSSLFALYSAFFNLFTRFDKSHFRRIERVDKEGNEEVIYLEIKVKRRKYIAHNEFDKYKI